MALTGAETRGFYGGLMGSNGFYGGLMGSNGI